VILTTPTDFNSNHLSTNTIINASSNLLLDPSLYIGTNVIQSQDTGSLNQLWTFIPLGEGYDLIVNAQTGWVLEDPNYSCCNGTNLDTWVPNGGSNQQWQVNYTSQGNYLFITFINRASGLVLEDPNFSNQDGTAMDQWQWNGGLNQQWVLGFYIGQPAALPLQSTALNITGNASTNDSTSTLNDYGPPFARSSFAMIADPTSSSGAASGTNVGTATGIGPAVGVALPSGPRTGAPAIGGLAGAGTLSPSRYGALIGQRGRPAQGSSSDLAALDAVFADYGPMEYHLMSGGQRRGRVRVLLQSEWEKRTARISYNLERRSSHAQEDAQAIHRPGEGRHPAPPSPRTRPRLGPM
jgi:hypothetical protein